jgi:hypothetical protein
VRRNLVIGALLAALAVAAMVDAVRRDGGDEQAAAATATAPETGPGRTLTGPDMPAPGALPGSLVLAAPADCRLREIDLAAAALGEPGPETLCRVWVSPTGDQAVVESGRGESPGSRKLELVTLGDPPEAEEELGIALGAVSWSPDGKRIAWCEPGGDSVVLVLASGDRQGVAGCDPRFAPTGSVFTTPAQAPLGELWRDGAVELDSSDLAEGFDEGTSGPIEVLEYDVAPDGLIAVTVRRLISTGSKTVLELWRDDGLEASVPLPRRLGGGASQFGELLRFGPTGNELAIGYTSGAGELTLVDLGLRRIVLRSAQQRAFAWSPDGGWLALAIGDEIRVYGSLRDVPAYVIPAAASTLGWAAGKEAPAEG